jgi:hypothetical protein
MAAKIGLGEPELASRPFFVGTIVASLEESRLTGAGDAPGFAGPGEAGSAMVMSGIGTPAAVIASESSAGCGMAAELSPLETAVPSCALRDARSASSAMFSTVRLAGPDLAANAAEVSGVTAVYLAFRILDCAFCVFYD